MQEPYKISDTDLKIYYSILYLLKNQGFLSVANIASLGNISKRQVYYRLNNIHKLENYLFDNKN